MSDYMMFMKLKLTTPLKKILRGGVSVYVDNVTEELMTFSDIKRRLVKKIKKNISSTEFKDEQIKGLEALFEESLKKGVPQPFKGTLLNEDGSMLMGFETLQSFSEVVKRADPVTQEELERAREQTKVQKKTKELMRKWSGVKIPDPKEEAKEPQKENPKGGPSKKSRRTKSKKSRRSRR